MSGERDGLAAACGWIDSKLDELWSPVTLLPSLKAAGELGHAADQLIRTRDPRWVALGEAWLQRAWRWMEGGELLRRLVAADPRFLPVAVTFLPFHLHDLHNGALRATLVEQLRHVVLGPLEWTIVDAALEIMGIECGAEAKRLSRLVSILALRPPPDRIPVDAIYLLAHECLYANRWGRISPSYAPEVHAYLDGAVPVLLDRCCRLGDADLLAEVLITAQLHPGAPAIGDEPWRVLEAARRADGSVHATAHAEKLLPRFDHPVLGRTFHTTIAAIIAWTCALPR